MRRTLKLILALSATAAAGCSVAATGPETEFNGIKYTAEVADIVGALGTHQYSVIVTLTNTSGVQQTRTYPASCPVRIRLYRVADNSLLYDETRRVCDETPAATISVDAFSSKTLQSGVRFSTTFVGDSLPHTTYTVRAVVKTEGTRFVEVLAGTIAL